MPNRPTLDEAHVDMPLTTMSVAYRQEQDVYVYKKAFREIPVKRDSDLYYVYDRASWNRMEMQRRGLSSEAAGGGYRLSNERYSADMWSLAVDIDPREIRNADNPLTPRADGSDYLVDQRDKRAENIWASTFYKVGVWATNLLGVPGAPGAGQFKQWDQAGSDPLANIASQRLIMGRLTGRKPNIGIPGPGVWEILKNHPLIKNNVSGGATTDRPSIVTKNLVAALMELDEIMIPEGIANFAEEGEAEDSQYLVDEKGFLLLYSNPTPGLKKPSAGYTFVSNEQGGMLDGQRIKAFIMKEKNFSERLEIDATFDMKVTGADLGVWYGDVIA